jgi:O-antigen ligase
MTGVMPVAAGPREQQMSRWLLLGVLAAMSVVAVGVSATIGLRYIAFAFMAMAMLALFAVLALRRFAYFVALVLVVRPLLDTLKVVPGSGAFQPTSLLSMAFLCVAPVWLVMQRRRFGPAPLTPLTAATMGYLVASVLSAAGSQFLTPSAVEVSKTASWCAMFLVVRRLVQDRGAVRLLLAAVGTSAAIPMLLGLYEVLSPGAGRFMEYKDGIYRLRSTFDESNNFARYLALLLLLAVPLVSRLPRAWRLLVSSSAVLAALLLFETYTRAAWVGLGTGLLTILWFNGRRTVVAVAVGAVAVVALVPGLASSLSTAGRPAPNTAWTNNSVGWRLEYWQQVAPLALEQPATGVGPGTTEILMDQGKEPHNEYLRAAVEGGVVGVIAYLALLAAGVGAAVALVRRRGPSLDRSIAIAAAAVVVAVIVSGFASNIVDSVSFMWFYAVVTALPDGLSWTSRPANSQRTLVRKSCS